MKAGVTDYFKGKKGLNNDKKEKEDTEEQRWQAERREEREYLQTIIQL